MKKQSFFLLILASSISGCYTKNPVGPITSAQLNNYPALVSAQKKPLMAARRDLIEASNRCRDIHNNYEMKSKQAEATKLTLGTVGGISGITGSALIAAGTGGVVGGIAAGLAGVISLTLGNSEKGPLSTSYYTKQKEGIATLIKNAVNDAKNETDPEKIYAIASSLAMSCLADDLDADAP
ncbi:hypothetical protein [Lelliottia amnigena]|uniref:hypothetical protein n=1 Tax=Lelliottia amnigena TaxID=61646 RepID=UPI00192CA99A|nr:hypothetical protein [Lelliottia amnigena]MBL5928868.1 hypothetical protein [Lelliottia amnigena]